jgi:DUF971 family protein
MSDRTRVTRLKEVGRYALGVEWGDGHESIIPYRNVRRACPCETCTAAPAADPAPAAVQPVHVEVLGGESVFVRFADEHETILLTDELRDLCRCARCVGEPDYPVSGR